MINAMIKINHLVKIWTEDKDWMEYIACVCDLLVVAKATPTESVVSRPPPASYLSIRIEHHYCHYSLIMQKNYFSSLI